MQINPMCEEFRGGSVKAATFSGTSDVSGNVAIALEPTYIIIVRINESQYMSYPFVYANGNTYIHVTDTSGNTAPNVSVSGTVFYIEEN